MTDYSYKFGYPDADISPPKASDYFTLTSTAGKFVFRKDVLLSHAKLIRDAVTGRFHAPFANLTPDNVAAWVKLRLSGSVNKTPFEWIPN